MGHEPTKTEEGLTERDKVALFIGSNTERYLKLYDALSSTEVGNAKQETKDPKPTSIISEALSTNWIVFAFAPFWLIYRKLYRLAVIYSVVVCSFILLWSLYFSFGLESLFLSITIVVLVNLAAATEADIAYVRHVRKSVAALKDQNLAQEVQVELIKKKGGTSGLSVCAVIFLIITLAVADFTVTEYTAARSLPDCEDESFRPTAKRLLRQELERRDVEYTTIDNVRATDIGEQSPDDPYCALWATVDGVTIFFQLFIRWENQTGGPVDYQIEDTLMARGLKGQLEHYKSIAE